MGRISSLGPSGFPLGPELKFVQKSLFHPPELSRKFTSTPCHKIPRIFSVLAPIYVIRAPKFSENQALSIHVPFIISSHTPPTTTHEDSRSTSFWVDPRRRD